MPVTVFERETDPDARSQDGTLDIHEDTGQAALRTAGLFDEFLALSRPESQEWRLYDRHATLIRHDQAGQDDLSRPEIDRGQLRALLLDSLAPGTVRWGQKATTAQQMLAGLMPDTDSDDAAFPDSLWPADTLPDSRPAHTS
ncbi:hypothetical protein [Streptomyces nigrescens]|uniref:hypothetical protein n=1 Tax=Streptomyces nigrescens TaxID=1920 RepID=UPI00349614D7